MRSMCGKRSVIGQVRVFSVVVTSSFLLAAGSAMADHHGGEEGQCIDTDGDGWGWTGTESCLIESTVQCIDTDGDGWGWTGTESCLVGQPVNTECIDTDGDGWGWDGTNSCRPGSMPADMPAPSSDDLVSTAVNAGNFTILATALEVTGLDAVLSDPSNAYTVLAPNDQAFAKLGDDVISALIADPDTLAEILLYHVLEGSAGSDVVSGLVGETVSTVAGGDIGVSINDESLYVNTSKVIRTDIMASNGVIHVLDTIMLPPEPETVSGSLVDVAIANGSFTTLVAALQATGLDSVLADTDSTFTVFAPTDDAFDALGGDTIAALLADPATLSSILLQHVVPGEVDSITALSLTGNDVSTAAGNTVRLSIRQHALFVNNSRVVMADIVTDNGIIHVIDAVIQ